MSLCYFVAILSPGNSVLIFQFEIVFKLISILWSIFACCLIQPFIIIFLLPLVW